MSDEWARITVAIFEGNEAWSDDTKIMIQYYRSILICRSIKNRKNLIKIEESSSQTTFPTIEKLPFSFDNNLLRFVVFVILISLKICGTLPLQKSRLSLREIGEKYERDRECEWVMMKKMICSGETITKG